MHDDDTYKEKVFYASQIRRSEANLLSSSSTSVDSELQEELKWCMKQMNYPKEYFLYQSKTMWT